MIQNLKHALLNTGIPSQILYRLGLYRSVQQARYRRTHRAEWKAVYQDYLSCKDDWETIATDVPPGSPDQTVWLMNGTGFTGMIKLEVVLGLLLRLAGYLPEIVEVNTHLPDYRLFHSMVGHQYFLEFSNYRMAEKRRKLPDSIHAFFDGQPSILGLLHLQYRRVDVGRIALSNYLYWNKFTRFDISNPQTQKSLMQDLANIIRNVHAAEKMIEDSRPALLCVVEKGLSPNADIVSVCIARDVPVVQYVNSQHSNSFILKRFNYQNRHNHPSSLHHTTWEDVKQMPWSDEQEQHLLDEFRRGYEEGTWFGRKYLHENKKFKSAHLIREQLGLDPNKKTVVVFSHVLWDATFFYGESLFEDYETWLLETIKAACQNPSVNWVIKLHPDLVWKLKYENYSGELRDVLAIKSEVGALPDHITLVMPEIDISTYSFFDITDYCLTVRGTIGIEMACHAVPVITAGTGRYSGMGFTFDSDSQEEYLEKLAHIAEHPPMDARQIELARRFAYTLFLKRPWELESFIMTRPEVRDMGKITDYNLQVDISLNDLKTATDIQLLKSWFCSRKVDYLSD